MKQNGLAIGLAVLMVVSVAAPAVGATTSAVDSLEVGVTQDDGVTVTVTDGNSTGVENASVNVTTLSENVTYDGAGEYATDANGTVALPAPNETVNVSVEASFDNETATTEAELTAGGNETGNQTTPFGLQVTDFISGLNDTEGPRGLTIAAWVTENNPGNSSGLPDHVENKTRGPPDHAGNNSENKTRGPPDHAGNNSENKTQGPPDHAGGNETENGTQGPPDDAGNGDDSDENKGGGNGNSGDNGDNGNGNGDNGSDGNGNGADGRDN